MERKWVRFMNISFWKGKGNKYAVFLLVGILILILCIPTNNKTITTESKTETISEDDLENQLKKVLSAMEGVGEVEVMISTETVSSDILVRILKQERFVVWS